ncbi:hypothetical protein [Mucilaginibacter sp.]|uniref:hypothetical protein n=1 Tax=Mucilaginibacter sp. TaxID=1882438 RepID=UPI003266E070
MRFNLKAVFISILITGLTFAAIAQDDGVTIPANIVLAQDSVTKQLVGALNSFLLQKEKPNKENSCVLKEALLETSALLDEMKGVEQNAALKGPNIYKPQFNNLIKNSDGSFTIQLSYLGVTEGRPQLKAVFTLRAQQTGGAFYFYSPLKQNTSAWKTKESGYITFKFKDTLNAADAKAFAKNVAFLDRKLQSGKPIVHYYCDNFLEAQHLLGVDYKSDYAGVGNNNLTANEGGVSLIINGWSSGQHRFDPHDLFHDRLRTVMSSDVINRPVDEGCAYLYGGSWGKSWEEVSAMFNTYVKDNPNADWLQLYLDAKNYYNDGGKIFKISYMINALVVQKLEKEKGFSTVMELLGCGKKEAGDANYFKALEKLTGINKANFNTEVSKLIKGS